MNTVLTTQTSSIPAFEYSSLSNETHEIRLIRIQSSQDSEIVKCSIEHVQPTNDLSYDCLSYTWGEQTRDRHDVLLNSQSFTVGHNLWTFLYTARKHGYTKKIFIDAICIDQSDTVEKSRQVRLMSEIYARATRVIVWLGFNDREANICGLLHDEHVKHHVLRLIHDDSWRAILTRTRTAEYWQRAWVWQEMLLTKRLVMLRPDSRKFTSVHHFLSALKVRGGTQVIEDPLPTDEYGFMFMRDDVKTPDMLLSDALHLSTPRKCTIPRDRIFSVLALAKRRPVHLVDYEMTDERLLWQVVTEGLQSTWFYYSLRNIGLASESIINEAVHLSALAFEALELRPPIAGFSTGLSDMITNFEDLKEKAYWLSTPALSGNGSKDATRTAIELCVPLQNASHAILLILPVLKKDEDWYALVNQLPPKNSTLRGFIKPDVHAFSSCSNELCDFHLEEFSNSHEPRVVFWQKDRGAATSPSGVQRHSTEIPEDDATDLLFHVGHVFYLFTLTIPYHCCGPSLCRNIASMQVTAATKPQQCSRREIADLNVPRGVCLFCDKAPYPLSHPR